MAMRALGHAARPLAGLALAAALAAAGASYAAQTPKPKNAPNASHARPVVVRAETLAGTQQTVHAYVALDDAKYVADFPVHLGVRIVGGKNAKAKRRVKFVCVNRGCHLYAPDQPEGGDRKTPADYEIDAKDGKASLHVSIESDEPAGTYAVYAEPIAKDGEVSARSGTFILISR
jgi:hypothetical protein